MAPDDEDLMTKAAAPPAQEEEAPPPPLPHDMAPDDEDLLTKAEAAAPPAQEDSHFHSRIVEKGDDSDEEYLMTVKAPRPVGHHMAPDEESLLTKAKAAVPPAEEDSFSSATPSLEESSTSLLPPQEDGDAANDLLAAAVRSSGGVPWTFARLMVRGPGGAGKSSTVEAMAGKAFDSQHASTVGASCEDLELLHQDLTCGSAGGAMRVCAGEMADNQYRLALAAHAAELLKAKERGAELPTGGGCLLDAIPRPSPPGEPDSLVQPCAPRPARAEGVRGSPRAAGAAEESARREGAVDVGHDSRDHVNGGGGGRGTAGPGHVSLSSGSRKSSQGPRSPSPGPAPAGPLPADARLSAATEADAPQVDRDLVIRYQKGDLRRNLVLRVQDTGGQPVFLSVLELLTTPDGTVYMIVFNLARLQENFEDVADNVVDQLKSVQLFAAGAPVILVGTRRDQVSGGDARLQTLSDDLLGQLKKRCAQVVEGLQSDPASGRCFFGVENSKGFAGDETIRELVKAVERAAYKLPSMSKMVPIKWLQVHDHLQAIAKSQRTVSLEKIRELALDSGMPHDDLSIEEDLTAMMHFFHSLNVLLWWDTPALRHLVVLDPQWIVDAVCCVIRDYNLTDHAGEFDQQAIREVPAAWHMLTDGRATLQRQLANILWSGRHFESHKAELLDIMTRFGLAMELPGAPTHFLIPSLLPSAHSSADGRPSNWPRHQGAEMRIFFSLQQGLERKLIWYDEDFRDGFFPARVFHRLCAACLGCGDDDSARLEPRLTHSAAYVVIAGMPATLTYKPRDSSIQVAVNVDGVVDSVSAIADRLSLLLSEELACFQNLQHYMLVPIPAGDAFVNIDELPKATRLDHAVMMQGETIGLDVLKEKFAYWFTDRCEFYFVDADRLREKVEDLPVMVPLQQLRREKPDWLVRKEINFRGIISGAYAKEFVALSYRWMTPEHPDPEGEQLAALREHLREHTEVKFAFVDYLCMAQGKERTPKDKAEFKLMLPNINLLYLGASVLAYIYDGSFMKRFWPLFESWLSHMSGSTTGLVSASKERLRCTVKCREGNEDIETCPFALQEKWWQCNAERARELLGYDHVRVTNLSDKEVQLWKIHHLDFLARRTASQKEAELEGGEGAQGSAQGKPANWLRRSPHVEATHSNSHDEATHSNSHDEATLSNSHVEALEASLASIFHGAALAPKMQEALEWFENNGLTSLDEVREAKMEKDFAEAKILGLKPGQQNLLFQRLQDRRP